MQSLPVNNTFLKIVAIMNYMNYDIVYVLYHCFLFLVLQ